MKKRGVKKSKPLTLKQKKFLAEVRKYVAKEQVSFWVFGKKVTWVVTGDVDVLERPILMSMTAPATSRRLSTSRTSGVTLAKITYQMHWKNDIADTTVFSKKAIDVDPGEIVLVPSGNHDDKYYAAERIPAK